MREEISDVVHPVLSYGLALRDDLLKGAARDFSQVQQELMRLLKSEHEPRKWPDYGRGGAPLDMSAAGMTLAGVAYSRARVSTCLPT